METVDGSRYEEAVDYPLGVAEAPLSKDRLATKFRDITEVALAPERQDGILEGAYSITEFDSVRSFVERL